MAIMQNGGSPDGERNDITDVRMCREYLEHFPNPSLDSMAIFIPTDGTDDWRSFCEMDWEYKLRILKQAGANDIEGAPLFRIKELAKDQYDTLTEIDGRVVGIADNELFKEWVSWECEACGAEWKVGNGSARRPRHSRDECSAGQILEPGEKPMRPRLVELPDDNDDLVDSQIIRIEEFDRDGKHQAVVLTCRVKGREMLWRVRIGQKIKLRGILNKIKKTNKDGEHRYARIYEIFSIKSIDDDILLTDEDIQYIRSEMQKPGYYQKVLRSIAPWIVEMDAAKETIMLVLASIGWKRPIKVLWIGDPGTGKTELMVYAARIAPTGFAVTAGNAKYTGLTTTSYNDPDSGRWMVVFGLLSYTKFLALDELQVMDAEQAKKLNDVIESGKIRYTLAGGNSGEIDAPVAMVIGCNPNGGTVNDANVQEHLAFLGKNVPAFVSRMSLIFYFKDVIDDRRDNNVADAVLNNSSEDPSEKYKEDWMQYETPLDLLFRENPVYYFGENTLAKIFQYVSTIPIKELPKDYHKQVKAEYLKKRKDVASKLNKLMTPRFLRDSIKLAQARGRMCGLAAPTQEDIDAALKLQENTMEISAFDPITGETDSNLLNANKGKRQLKRESKDLQFWNGFEEACKDENGIDRGYCDIGDLIYWLSEQADVKWETDDVRNYVDRMIKSNRMDMNADRLKRLNKSF